jgi:hypothetical protein
LIDLWLLIFVFVNMYQINYMIVVFSVISISFFFYEFDILSWFVLFMLILYWTWPNYMDFDLFMLIFVFVHIHQIRFFVETFYDLM